MKILVKGLLLTALFLSFFTISFAQRGDTTPPNPQNNGAQILQLPMTVVMHEGMICGVTQEGAIFHLTNGNGFIQSGQMQLGDAVLVQVVLTPGGGNVGSGQVSEIID